MRRAIIAGCLILSALAGYAKVAAADESTHKPVPDATAEHSPVTGGDTIVERSNNRIAAKIVRVLPMVVEYKKLSNPDGPLYVVRKRAVAQIIYANGEKEVFSDTGNRKFGSDGPLNRFAASLELHYGAFGLFNVDNDFTKSKYGKFTFGGTPSLMVRLHRHFAAGAECMLLWGKPQTADPLRLIINPNIRTEIIFPLREKLTLKLIAAGGMSVWPVYDTVGILDSTYFNQRSGWNARVAFGGEWKLNARWSVLCNVGYSASSSESNKVWITHDMMMVSAGMRMFFVKFEK